MTKLEVFWDFSKSLPFEGTDSPKPLYTEGLQSLQFCGGFVVKERPAML